MAEKNSVPEAKRKRVAPGVLSEGSKNAPRVTSCKLQQHPGFIWGLCYACGEPKNRRQEEVLGDKSGVVAMRYIHDELEVSANDTERARGEEVQRALESKKLFLVLDLDHTLLNSCKFADICPKTKERLERVLHKQQHSERLLYHLPHIGMWTKLRPHIFKFLEKARHLFQLYIYTMGDKAYAAQMASILDPGGQLFRNRVVASSDSTSRHCKDLDIVLGTETAVLIMDDTKQVWPKNNRNLLEVERYHYFPASAANFKSSEKSLLERSCDEDEELGVLASLWDVLQRVHGDFFLQAGEAGVSADADVRPILQARRRGILAGVNIVFSRVFPEDLKNPEEHRTWQMAESLGAKCFTKMGDNITHVVARSLGTAKVRWAQANHKQVVSTGWVECSSVLWKRADEKMFALLE